MTRQAHVGCKGFVFLMVLAVATPLAMADFIISATRTPSALSPGFDVVRFYALNDGTGPQAGSTDLLALDIRMTNISSGILKVGFVDEDNDMVFDYADLTGLAVNDTGTDASASYIRIGPAVGWNNVYSDPLATNLAAWPNSSFRVAGFRLNGINATIGLGVQFAVAVIPDGDTVQITSGAFDGGLGASSGGPFYMMPVTSYPIPEPAAIGLLGIASLLALRRRS